MIHKVIWQVSLSDGSTFQEGKRLFEEIEAELSPWNKLIEYIKIHGLYITSLSLITEDGRTFNLPSLSQNPNFAAFRNAPKPSQFKVFRAIATEIDVKKGIKGVKDWYTVIEAIYENGPTIQTWVNEHDTRNSWSLLT